MYLEIFECDSELLKALAHPRRLEIIHLLRDQELCVSDIYSMLDLPQANISQHLMILREVGIVTARKEGKQILYHLSNYKVIKACDLLREVSTEKHPSSVEVGQLQLNMKELLPLTHDPVCKMRLSPKTASFSHSHNGQTYYFCASGCLKTFEKNPEKYAISKG